MQEGVVDLFGKIDIYLFDQIVRGRFERCRKVLDVGCGTGRNLKYLSKHGVESYGVDKSSDTVDMVRQNLPHIKAENFCVAEADNLPFAEDEFDAVICSAVLHFAENDEHFNRMVNEVWRVLSPGGLLFVRLASSIGIEGLITPLDNNCYKLPDGSTRYLVDEQKLITLTEELGGQLLDPIKTTNVQNLRCMTTWVVKKLA